MQSLEVNGFFSELGSRLAEARAGDRRRCETFFDTLTSRLAIARSADESLDRQLARRFNVFDFVNTSEIGLSRIIAHLLDDGSHGQGTLYLQTLLRALERESWELEGCQISAATEQEADGRRIDIIIKIGSSSTKRCLAFENKPYAADQPRQVADYLESLDKKYGHGFLLVYLSARGEAPSESSLPKEELASFASRFKILPYVRSERDWGDEFDCVRSADYSLAEWLAECSKLCDVDRLRWFLRDGERFCRREFGEETMATDSETQQIEEFLRSNPVHMRTALAVYEAWPQIGDRVRDDFYNALYSQVEGQVKRGENLPGDLQLLQVREKRSYGLALSRSVWRDSRGGRAQVALHYDIPYRKWFFGVRATTADGPNLVSRLSDALGPPPGVDTAWTWWKWAEYHWTAHIPQLVEELQQKRGDTIVGGEIMDRSVRAFIDVVRKAVPVLDRFELDGP